MTTQFIKTLKPRNPLVAPCHRRLAGAHGRSESARRVRDRLALQREARDWLHQRQSP
jgi:hypothetical protein